MTDAAFEKLKSKFPASVEGHSEFCGQTAVYVAPDQFHEVALFLRDDEDMQFDLLVDVYGTDRLKLGQSPEQQTRFATNYELYSVSKNKFLRVVVSVPDPDPSASNGTAGELPVLPSVTDVWPTANW